jgi:hypothetical protein
VEDGKQKLFKEVCIENYVANNSNSNQLLLRRTLVRSELHPQSFSRKPGEGGQAIEYIFNFSTNKSTIEHYSSGYISQQRTFVLLALCAVHSPALLERVRVRII